MAESLFVSGGGAGGGLVGPSNVVFLELGGNDATGLRGDASKPFATLAAAIGAMFQGDQLRIGPGLFPVPVSPVVLPIDATVQGSGREATVISGAPAVDVLTAAPLTTRFEAADLQVLSKPGGRCFVLDGAGSLGAFGGGGIEVRNVRSFADAGGIALFVRDAVRFDVADSSFNIAEVQTSLGAFRDTEVTAPASAGVLTVRWDNDDPDRPPLAPAVAPIQFYDCTIDTLFTQKQAQVEFAPGCRVLSMSSGPVPLDTDLGVTKFPVLRFHGEVIADVGYTGAGVLPDTIPGSIQIDFDQAKIGGKFEWGVSGPNFGRQTVRANALVCQGTISADDGIDMVINSDSVNQSGFTTLNSGTITPSHWGTPAPLAVAAGANPALFGFTAASAPEIVQVTADALAAAPVVANAATTTGFNIDATGAGNVNVLARWV